MEICLMPLCAADVAAFKQDMQAAFQAGAAAAFANLDEEILPEADIDHSLETTGAAAYKAVADGQMVGGAIVVIDPATQHNHLDFLYVKCGVQSKGVGQAIWSALEQRYPDTRVWETVTPYFETRNLHFYINRCGFHAVEFYNPQHKDETIPEDMIGGDLFFRFEKQM